MIPHVRAPPVDNVTKRAPCGADTSRGLALGVVVPLPSNPPFPQQYAAPSALSAHVCPPPGLSALNRTPAGTATNCGIALRFDVPSPSSPYALLPQQYAACAVVMAQVRSTPALTAVKVRLIRNPALAAPASPSAVATSR